MILKNKIYIICITLLFSSIFISCEKKQVTEIVFDNSEPLALAPDIKWALIIEPYAAFKDSLAWDSQINGYCRKGDILQIISRSEDKENVSWYKFEQGWLPASCLSVYSNRMKAQTASKDLK